MSDNDTGYGLVAQALATAIESTERRLTALPLNDHRRADEQQWRSQAMEQLINLGKVASVRGVRKAKER